MSDFFTIEGHPTTSIYAVLEHKPTESIMDCFEKWLEALATRRNWTIRSPELIDYIEENDSSGTSTPMYRCALRIYSAFPPWGEKLPKEIDREHFFETKFLIEELTEFSEREGCDFQLQLDSAFVGTIRQGIADERIVSGLIGEWEKCHE